MENCACFYLIMHIFITCIYKHVYKKIHSITSVYFVHCIIQKHISLHFTCLLKACRCMVLSSPTQHPLSIDNVLLFYKTLFIIIFLHHHQIYEKAVNIFLLCFGVRLVCIFLFTQRSVFSFSPILRRQFSLKIPENCSFTQRWGMEIFTLKGKICTSSSGGWPRKVG